MLDSLDKCIIKKLQEDIPIVEEPYGLLAAELGIEEDELITRIKSYHESGILKRIAAVIYHRQAGFKANAMVVWKVPEASVEEAGNYMGSLSEVSHCYERKICENWEYNLFTMIHGKDKEQCENIIENISNKIGIKDYKILYSTREFKKSSMKYFK
jgi:Transcriptional regulators